MDSIVICLEDRLNKISYGTYGPFETKDLAEQWLKDRGFVNFPRSDCWCFSEKAAEIQLPNRDQSITVTSRDILDAYVEFVNPMENLGFRVIQTLE